MLVVTVSNQKKVHFYAKLFMDDNSIRMTCAESILKKTVLLMHSIKTIMFYGFNTSVSRTS